MSTQERLRTAFAQMYNAMPFSKDEAQEAFDSLAKDIPNVNDRDMFRAMFNASVDRLCNVRVIFGK